MASKTDYMDGMNKRGRMSASDAAQIKGAAAKAAGRTASMMAQKSKPSMKPMMTPAAGAKAKKAMTEPIKVQTSRWTRNRPEGA